MKKLLLLIVLISFVSIGTINAQCTPIPFSGGSLTSPDTTQGIPVAVETQAYSQIINVRIPADTIYMGAVIPIDSAGILSISGMPSTMSWTTNSVSNYWPGDTFGCIVIQGTPAVGDAGNYFLSIVVEVRALGTGLPYTMVYEFEVLDASHIGVDLSKRDEFQLMQNQPNPFGSKTRINYYLPKAQIVDFKVYDIVGNCVVKEKYNAQKSKNTILFSKGDLPSGIYIYELNTGTEIIRKRMVIK